MAVVSGIVSALSVDDSSGTPVDISSYVTQLNVGTPTNLQDITTLDKHAIARLALLKDFTVSGTYAFGTVPLNVFKADPAGYRTTVVALANAAATLTFEALLSDHQLTRDQSGYLTGTFTLENGDGAVGVWS